MMDVISSLAWFLAPLAILYFISKYFFMDVFGIGRRRARREFPSVAESLGLQFTAPDSSNQIGCIKGMYKGRKIKILPDNNAQIKLYGNGLPEMFLSIKDYERPAFDTDNSSFNKFFITRDMHEPNKTIENINNNADKLRFIETFSARWKRALNYFEVSEEGLRLSMQYGMNSHIPVKVLQQLLPDLNQFLTMMEDVLSGEKKD